MMSRQMRGEKVFSFLDRETFWFAIKQRRNARARNFSVLIEIILFCEQLLVLEAAASTKLND